MIRCNVFNNLNLVNPEASIGSTTSAEANPSFGQSQSALAGRVINLQARLSF